MIQGELVNGSIGQIVRFETAKEALAGNTYIVDTDKRDDDQELLENAIAWPVVRFINGKEVFIIPQKFTVNNARGEMEACRKQVSCVFSSDVFINYSIIDSIDPILGSQRA